MLSTGPPGIALGSGLYRGGFRGLGISVGPSASVDDSARPAPQWPREIALLVTGLKLGEDSAKRR
jgi:hypothetical protein